MKGNNEFVYFLVGGMLIIAALLVFLGADVYKFGAKAEARAPGIIEAVKVFEIPDIRASNEFTVQSTRPVSKNVFNGLLFGEEKLAYDITKPDLQSVKVKFAVAETNNLGRLVIKANGKTASIFAFNPGEHEVEIPSEFISNRTTIEVAAESSYWKIWAPAIYTLENVQVEYSSYTKTSSQYKFYLGEEFINIEFAKLDLAFTENVGMLVVDVNGRTLWESSAGNLQSITIDKSFLRLGDNIVKFRAAPDSKFSGRAAVVVIFLAQFPEAINQTGVVTAVQPLVGHSNQFYA